MKRFIRETAIYSLSFYFVSLVLDGVKVSGGLPTFLLVGIALSFLFLLLRPILNVLTFPLFFLSFGSFSVVINAIILYVLTILIPQIHISAFTFQGVSFFGFTVPRLSFNTFFAFMVTSIALSICAGLARWITKK